MAYYREEWWLISCPKKRKSGNAFLETCGIVFLVIVGFLLLFALVGPSSPSSSGLANNKPEITERKYGR